MSEGGEAPVEAPVEVPVEALGFTEEKRAAKEQEMKDLSTMLKEVAASTETSGEKDKSKELIVRFADEVDVYVTKIQEAATLEEAENLVKEATGKKEKWMKMLNMLAAKEQKTTPQEQQALAQAEEQMVQMADELRKCADTGNASVVKGISAVADQVDAALVEFRAAGTTQQKWAAYTKMEEARAWWLKGMSQMKKNMEKNLKQAKKMEDARQKAFEELKRQEAAGESAKPIRESCVVAEEFLDPDQEADDDDAGGFAHPPVTIDASNSCDV